MTLIHTKSFPSPVVSISTCRFRPWLASLVSVITTTRLVLVRSHPSSLVFIPSWMGVSFYYVYLEKSSLRCLASDRIVVVEFVNNLSQFGRNIEHT